MQDALTGQVRHWSTQEVPQSQRLDYFAAALGDAVVPFAIDRADPARFQVKASFAHLGAIAIWRNSVSPHRSMRGSQQLARAGEHKFHLVLPVTGTWEVEHRSRLLLQPGDILVHDTRYPFNMASQDSSTVIDVAISDTWLRRWLPNPSVLSARHLTGPSAWRHALSCFLIELVPELASAPPLPMSVLCDQVGSLLALAAGADCSPGRERQPALRGLHQRILDRIVERCTEPQLTATDVASSLSISLRTLHRALAGVGQTFGGRLIEARVRMAERMLLSPLFNRVTAAEIGRRAGFASVGHFARVVRRRTGRTPAQLRLANLEASSQLEQG